MNTQQHSDHALVFGLLDAANRIELLLNRTLSNTRGISFREYHLLRELSGFHRAAATRVDLAAAVGLTPSAVTRALKPLEKLGYVTTQKSDRDARRSLAELTAGGRELLADAQLAVDDVIAGLDLERVDRPAVIASLEQLARK
ncbi:MAG: MarR family winged helix-turn-helix transcriptional regulator [Pseudomonadales bacterium]